MACALQYQRADAENNIAKALEITVNNDIKPLKHKVMGLYEEYFGEIELEENKKQEDSSFRLEFNFIPGALEKANNKIVELRCETPKDRNKRTKNSKRSLSRA